MVFITGKLVRKTDQSCLKEVFKHVKVICREKKQNIHLILKLLCYSQNQQQGWIKQSEDFTSKSHDSYPSAAAEGCEGGIFNNWPRDRGIKCGGEKKTKSRSVRDGRTDSGDKQEPNAGRCCDRLRQRRR